MLLKDDNMDEKQNMELISEIQNEILERNSIYSPLINTDPKED